MIRWILELDILDKKVAYFEGRPSGHPIHSEYAKIINSHFNYIDKYLRYHDKPSSPIIRYLSYLLTALFFPIKDFDVVFTEEGYFQLGLMRLFGRLKNKKLIGLMATHTAYFIKKKKYSKLTCKAFIETYKQYDSFICIGDIQYNLMSELLENTNVRIYKIFNGLNSTCGAHGSDFEYPKLTVGLPSIYPGGFKLNEYVLFGCETSQFHFSLSL